MNALTRLRRPHQTNIVTITLTGAPAAVTALARTLATTVEVLGMRHNPATTTDSGATPVITLEVTCTARTRWRAA